MDSPKSFKAKFARILLATAAKNESDLARILDIHPSSVGAAKKRNQIPTGWVEKVAEDFSVNSDWLFFGRGQMRVEEGSCVDVPVSGRPQEGIEMVSVVEARLTSTDYRFERSAEMVREWPFSQDFLKRRGDPHDMVLMRVSGESMEPEICDNDMVLIDCSKTDLFPGKIYAIGFHECVYLKRVDVKPGKLVFKSSNPDYPALETAVNRPFDGSLRIMGRVLWSGREFH